MKKLRGHAAALVLGILIGAVCFGGAGYAAITAQQSDQTIYVDGAPVALTAYNINGSNYVKLRDIGQAVGFNVYWDGAVYVDSSQDYTGEAPLSALPQSEDHKQEIVRLTNALRAEYSLPALTEDALLSQAAQVRAQEMAAATVYSHTRPDGREFSTVTDSAYVGENIHRISFSKVSKSGRSLAEVAVEEWAGSPGHLANMVNGKVSSLGVGLAQGVNNSGNACWYCVQLFLLDGHAVTWVDTPCA